MNINFTLKLMIAIQSNFTLSEYQLLILMCLFYQYHDSFCICYGLDVFPLYSAAFMLKD